jgi:hypothetical protein
MDLNEAETFVRVAEAGGMTPAAKVRAFREFLVEELQRIEACLGEPGDALAPRRASA